MLVKSWKTCVRANRVLAAEDLWHELEGLDGLVSATKQMELMANLRAMTGQVTRLLLARLRAGASLGGIIDDYRQPAADLMAALRGGRSGVDAIVALIEQRTAIIAVVELVNLAETSGHSLSEVKQGLEMLTGQLDLDWLAAAVGRLPAGNRWQARARSQLAADVAGLRQHLLLQLLAGTQTPTDKASVVVDELKGSEPQDLAMLSAGLAEIRRLVLA
jgi:glutamate dehydrogenase